MLYFAPFQNPLFLENMYLDQPQLQLMSYSAVLLVLWGAMNELTVTNPCSRRLQETEKRDVQLSTLACSAVRFRDYFSVVNTQLIFFWFILELSQEFYLCFFRHSPLCLHSHMSITLIMTKSELWFGVLLLKFSSQPYVMHVKNAVTRRGFSTFSSSLKLQLSPHPCQKNDSCAHFPVNKQAVVKEYEQCHVIGSLRLVVVPCHPKEECWLHCCSLHFPLLSLSASSGDCQVLPQDA